MAHQITMHSNLLWLQGVGAPKKQKHMPKLTEPEFRKTNIRAM